MTDKIIVYKWTCPKQAYPKYSQSPHIHISEGINWKYLFNI